VAPCGVPTGLDSEVVRRQVDRLAVQMDLPGPLGGLAQSIVLAVFVVTALAPHAAYLFTGTGIYGPKHERIKYGKEVRFFWWRQKKPMAVTSIAGMKPDTEWWTAAQKAVEIELDRRLSRIHARGINNANS